MNDKPFGRIEGDICNRNYCKGIIDCHPPYNCSCHINPPCGACTSPRNFCNVCGWEEKDDVMINGYIVTIDKQTEVYTSYELRKLDTTKIDWHTTKIDWHSHSHTNSSMIKRGCYPQGTDMEDVRKKVNGSFGGRFNYFGEGKFEFVAYTD